MLLKQSQQEEFVDCIALCCDLKANELELFQTVQGQMRTDFLKLLMPTVLLKSVCLVLLHYCSVFWSNVLCHVNMPVCFLVLN